MSVGRSPAAAIMHTESAFFPLFTPFGNLVMYSVWLRAREEDLQGFFLASAEDVAIK